MAGCECIPHWMDLKMQYLTLYVYPSIATSDGWQYIILEDVALFISWIAASDPQKVSDEGIRFQGDIR